MNLQSKLTTGKWMIIPDALDDLASTLSIKAVSPKVEVSQDSGFKLDSAISENANGNVAIIPINGILMKGPTSKQEEELGLCNIDKISIELHKAIEDPTVTDICLFFDSPGGETVGIAELGREIANCPKLTHGWTETKSASAAYWLMSQCDRVGMISSAMVGSIGCYAMIEDITGSMKMAGIKKEIISSGKYKLIGSKFRSLTSEEIQILQTDITKQHEQFKQVILSKRSIDPSHMEGLTYEGSEALANNLVDVVTDSFVDFLQSATYNKDNHMIKIQTPLKEEPKTAVAAVVEPVTKLAEAVPGVPGTKEETKPLPHRDPPGATPATAESPYGEKYVECPSCKHIWRPDSKHMLKKMEEEEPKEEPKEAKGKADDSLEKDKDSKVEPEKDYKTEKKAEEPKKEPEEEDTTKKMTLPSLESWNQVRGFTPVTNALHEAVNAFPWGSAFVKKS